MNRLGSGTLWLLVAGCATVGSHRHFVDPPKQDRCAAQASAAAQSACAQLREESLAFVRKLYVDDQVCIDGLHPLDDARGTDCQVRAFVAGVNSNQLQLEIRSAPDGSPYRLMDDWYFEDTSLADLALRARGYALPSELGP